MNLTINEYKPNEQLSNFVELYWSGDFNIQTQTVLEQKVVPNGCVELIIHLSDDHCSLEKDDIWSASPNYTVIGMYTKPYVVKFNKRVKVFSIRFKPEGIYHIFGIPAAEFGNGFEDMELVLGKGFKDFTRILGEKTSVGEMIACTNEYLLMCMYLNAVNISYVNHAADIIRKAEGFLSVDELSEQVFISKRQLEREFKNKLGITPKMFIRLSRLNKVTRMLNSGLYNSYSDIVFDSGYADQSHFIRDFKNFTGDKPTMFIKNREDFIVNPN